MGKKIPEYLTVCAVTSFILYLIILLLQMEKIDFRICFFFLSIILLVFFTRNKKINFFISNSYRTNPGFSKAIALFLLVGLPFVLRGNPYLIHICIMVGLYVIMGLGYNLYLGSFGMVNFCFGAYLGLGAYTSALLATHFHLTFWITLPLAGLAGLLGGAFTSLLTLKNKGFYYVLVTFAVQQVFHLLVNNMKWTGGPDGVSNIPYPTIGRYSLGEPVEILGFNLPFHVNFYFLTLFLSVLTFVLVRRIERSKASLTWNAIREDEIAANCQGINIFWRKMEAAAAGAFFGGLAGPLYAHYVGYISPEVFTWEVSAALLGMLILGGINNISGVIFGVALLTILPEKFQMFASYRTLIFGLIILFFLMFKPRGFIPEKVRSYERE